jgi:outer membrane protein TolC
MADQQRIFFRSAPHTLRLSGLGVAAVFLLAGCASKPPPPTSPPEPNPTPAASSPAQVGAASAVQSNAFTAPLSLEAAIARALRCSPQIMALQAAVEVAKQGKSAASNIPDPEAVLSWGKVANDFEDSGETPDSDDGRRIGGRFYVPNPFLMAPRVNAGTATFQAAQAGFQAARWLVESDVRRLFAQIHYLTEDVALTAELAHQYDLILEDARAREGQGAATASEIVAAMQRELEAQHEWDQARYRLQSARRELAGMLDLDLGSAPLELATNAPTLYPLPESGISPDLMQRVALQHRNDLAALHWRTLAAKSSYVEARNVRIPWIKDVGAVRRDSDGEWWLGIAVNVPLFSWTINTASGVQLAEFKLAEVNESNGAQVMRHEIRDAVDEFETQRRQQQRNQKELAPLLAEMQKTLDLLKRTPNVMASQLATTQAQITESKRLKLESDWLYQLAQLNLQRVVGAPLSVALNGREGKL